MTQTLSAAINDALTQRELLLRGVHRAQEHSEDAVRLENLLETLDSLLAIVTCTEARH